MTEEWDDDEFGTFESADAGSSNTSLSSVVTAPNNPPAWILEAQSPKNLESPTAGEKYSQTFTEHFEHKSLKPSDIESEEGSLDKNQKNQSLNAVPLKNISTDSRYEAFESGDGGVVFNLSGKSHSIVDKTNEVSQKPVAKVSIAQNDGKTKSESRIVLELQSKLDLAIVVKEQTEKSLSELKSELAELTEKMKIENEAKERSRREEISEIERKHLVELEELREESQKMVQLMTRQFSEATRRALEERQLDSDKNLEDVVQKCLALMDRQESLLEQKIKDDAKICEKKVKSLTENCEVKLKDFVGAECTKTMERCLQITEEAKSMIKEQIDELLRTQMELTTDSNKEAFGNLTKTYENQLELAFQRERLKSSDAMKESLENSRKQILDSVANEEKKNQKQREQNILALQMLLTASQEHLKELSSQNRNS